MVFTRTQSGKTASCHVLSATSELRPSGSSNGIKCSESAAAVDEVKTTSQACLAASSPLACLLTVENSSAEMRRDAAEDATTATDQDHAPHCKVLTLDKLPRQLLAIEYSVRGAIAIRAQELRRELRAHPERFTQFKEIVPANIGNPQSVGRRPITFNRQVLSCLLTPTLLGVNGNEKYDNKDNNSHPSFQCPFPDDVQSRCMRYLKEIPSMGAYSESQGIALFRRDIADFFERRDRFPCDPDSIFLTDGASSAIHYTCELLINKPSDGILIPVPEYPLYSATITRFRGTAVPFFLEEEKGWRLSLEELERAVHAARRSNVCCKALVIINPGNPTGALHRAAEMVDVIRFCERESLVLMADEVYQDNVYCDDAKFISFRSMVKKLGSPIELISFHSSSKCLAGECGFRGGLMQLENIAADVVPVLTKMLSVSLCSNTVGQAMLACILNPPLAHQPSYKLYREESEEIYTTLKSRASYTVQKLNRMPGVSCQPIDASLYAFPKITLPPKALEVASQRGIEPDMLYCMEMLESTGVVCVPGSGFHQRPGSFHFRLTILPTCLNSMLESINQFHTRFLEKYSSDS